MGDSLWGIKNGDLAAVKEQFQGPNADVNAELSQGRFPLIYAADYGQKEIIEYLISKGGDVNVTDQNGITPLLAAIWEGHTECVKLLLEKGAKKDGKTPDGQTYLDAAECKAIQDLLK